MENVEHALEGIDDDDDNDSDGSDGAVRKTEGGEGLVTLSFGDLAARAAGSILGH